MQRVGCGSQGWTASQCYILSLKTHYGLYISFWEKSTLHLFLINKTISVFLLHHLSYIYDFSSKYREIFINIIIIRRCFRGVYRWLFRYFPHGHDKFPLIRGFQRQSSVKNLQNNDKRKVFCKRDNSQMFDKFLRVIFSEWGEKKDI